jgi:hypothetical protein
MHLAGVFSLPPISLGQQQQEGFKISLLNQDARESVPFLKETSSAWWSRLCECFLAGDILRLWVSVTHLLGSWGKVREGSVCLSDQIQRLTLYVTHSLLENMSSICLKRITSTGCKAGSIFLSGPTAPWCNLGLGWPAIAWRRASKPTLCSWVLPMFVLPAYSYRCLIWWSKIIWRLTFGNILETDIPTWPSTQFLCPLQSPSLCLLVQPDSTYFSRFIHPILFPKILDNKIDLDIWCL